MEKPDCYKCEHRGTLPGNAHSCCKHPKVNKLNDDPFLSVMSIFASVGRVPGFQAGTKELNVKGNPHGIKMGWFNWPMNFDPVWLETCDGFSVKEKATKI